MRNPKSYWSSVGRPLWCAGREVGVGAVRAFKQPSFGCLILSCFCFAFFDAIVLILSVSRCYRAFYVVVIVVVAVFEYTCFLLFHLNRCASRRTLCEIWEHHKSKSFCCCESTEGNIYKESTRKFCKVIEFYCNGEYWCTKDRSSSAVHPKRYHVKDPNSK